MNFTHKKTFRPGEIWLDTAGKPIQAHGGGLLYDQATSLYYWYGENKDADTRDGRIDAIGVSCYSSADLFNWDNQGVVLPAVRDDEAHDLHPSKVMERPKVIFNESTGKYVMWLHVDHTDYAYARIGIAISDKPQGPFQYVRSFSPGGNDSRDMTLFKDTEGIAYVIYSSHWNSRMIIQRLNSDYMDVEPEQTEIFVKPGRHESREAPAMFASGGKYYLITSGCTGWHYNEAELAVADSVAGAWTVLGNPVIGAGSDTTFESQSTFVLPVQGLKDTFIFMADRWNDKQLRDSRYVWLPVRLRNGRPCLEWIDEWHF
jgi:hypothetical protein